MCLNSGCKAKVEDDLENLNSKPKSSKSIKPQKSLKETNEDERSIKVYICGAVINPGVYEASSSNRIGDIIKLAGGFNSEADVNYLNQASKLKDEQKIYVPTVDETSNMNDSNALNGENENNNENNNNKVNLNTASKEQLMTLPGIGEAKANKIIEYRTNNNGFAKIEDLKNITGIKDGVFNKIKDLITV